MHSSAARSVKNIAGVSTNKNARSMKEEVVASGQLMCEKSILMGDVVVLLL